MTTITTLAALLPVLLSTGRGSDVARAMAWPVFGGMLIEPFTTFVVPAIYCGYLELRVRRGLPVGDVALPQTSLEPFASGPYLPPPGVLAEVPVS